MNKQNTIAVLEIMHTKAREIKRKLEADERSFERVKRANLKKIGKYIEHLDKAIDAGGEIWEGLFL